MKKAILLFLFFGSMLSAQNRLQLRIAKDSILIGEPLKIELISVAPLQNIKELPAPKDTAWTILKTNADSALKNTGELWRYRLEIARYDSGYHLLSFLPIQLASDSLRCEATYVYVGFPPRSEIELMDIKAPRKAPFDYVSWILIPLSILLFIFGVYFLWKRFKPLKEGFSAKKDPPIPPKEKALQQLHRLQENQTWLMGPKVFYTEITDVLRLYLEEELHIQALEMSGTELASSLDSLALEAEDERKLKAFLLASDFAKYAERAQINRSAESEFKLLEQIISDYPKQLNPSDGES
jgi:hypothetical protein